MILLIIENLFILFFCFCVKQTYINGYLAFLLSGSQYPRYIRCSSQRSCNMTYKKVNLICHGKHILPIIGANGAEVVKLNPFGIYIYIYIYIYKPNVSLDDGAL